MFSRANTKKTFKPVLRTMCGALLAFSMNVAGVSQSRAEDPTSFPTVEEYSLEAQGWKLVEVRTVPRDLPQNDPQRQIKTIEDLLNERLDRERNAIRTVIQPELIRLEANYIRTAGAGEVVLHESSFHLEPRYRAFTAEGRDTLTSIRSDRAPQPVMYFLGYARTPLALPMVSNLSEALRGDEATYTVQLGILPLPKPAGLRTDSVKLYVIIERAIESNRSESIVNIERYAKEFTVREGEPVQLKLENAPPERRAYIVRLESNAILDFYDDFARHFTEHIWINTDRLAFALGKAHLSPVTSRLSIPYTVAAASQVEVELLSVLDSSPSLKIIDTVRSPADYLAEVDMKPMANGPYRYRFTARDFASKQVIFTETHDFVKRAPVIVPPPSPLATADTLQVGGKREDYRALLAQVNQRLIQKTVEAERLDHTLGQTQRERDEYERILRAQRAASIAGLRTHFGLGLLGTSAGTHLFFGVESKEPMLSFDVSFGYLGNKPPFVSSQKTGGNLTKLMETPKSLGLQVSWVPAKVIEDIAGPVFGLGYYGIWSTNPEAGGLRSATLLNPFAGASVEPMGEAGKLGLSLTTGPILGLGLDEEMLWDFAFRAYWRL
jgi:hypothetical protein